MASQQALHVHMTWLQSSQDNSFLFKGEAG